ncbi:MAG: ABC transporter substrate-binding protein [Candidatus Tectomicrobia bacterium]|uniref:ABC transporter substrate-binding protein n=1 Tax=Tectimicrobiota bacterium TaxID=2528274 RepID=A0A932MLP2_UNCTE|nr:ABC transporter substrate-binding protein [Candidatus Tectomicrobia bacterium]
MRAIRILAISLSLALALGAAADAAQKVRLHTDWKMEVSGDIPPFFLGVEKGYYKAEGLDVEILDGTGSGDAVRVMSAGSYEFGFADFGSLLAGRIQGAKVKAVMGLLQQGGGAFLYMKDSGIQTFKDLKGKTIAMSPGGSEDASIRAVMAKNGLSMEDVKWTYMPGMGKVFAVLGGTAHATGTLWNKMVPLMEVKSGKKVGYFSFADLGVNILHKGVFVNTDYLAKNGDTVRRFNRATQRAWMEAQKNPEAAVDSFLKSFPKQAKDKPMFMEVMKLSLKMIGTENTKGKPLGWMSEKDWASSQRVLVDYTPGMKGKALPAGEFFTNDYVPGVQQAGMAK